MKKRWVRRAVLLLSALLAVYGGVRLILYYSEFRASQRTSGELREAYETVAPAEGAARASLPEGTAAPAETPEAAVTEVPVTEAPAAAEPAGDLLEQTPYPGNPGLKVNSRFTKLRKKSGYIIGWIQMDDLDEAVVLKDNTFFLNHDARGNRNSNGAIFLDEGVSLLTRPRTITLYGHNMKSGAMFGNLRKYEDPAYCAKHRVFAFDTLYEDGKYAVFAVARIRLTYGTARYVDLNGLQSLSRSARQEGLDQLEAVSGSAGVLDVNPEDQLLLLVTCVGDDQERLVVAARRLRDGETENSLTMRKR